MSSKEINVKTLDAANFTKLAAKGRAPKFKRLIGKTYQGQLSPSLAEALGKKTIIRQFDGHEPELWAGDRLTKTTDLMRVMSFEERDGNCLEFGPGAIEVTNDPNKFVTLHEELFATKKSAKILVSSVSLETVDEETVSGFILFTNPQKVHPPPGLLSGDTLGPKEMGTVKAFAEALFFGTAAVLTPLQVAQNVDAHLTLIDRSYPKKIGQIKTALMAFELIIGPKFSRRPVEERIERIKEKLLNLKKDGLFGIYRDLARLKSLVYAGYYQDAKALQSIKFKKPAHRSHIPDPGGDRPNLVVMEPMGNLTCDIVVVGSGAGGAVAGAELAAKGKDVVIIDSGPYIPTDSITHNERDMTALYYKDGGLRTTANNDMAILQGRCIGGSTEVNNCISFQLNEKGRTHPAARKMLKFWEKKFGLRIDRDKLDESYKKVGEFLPIREITEEQNGPNGKNLLNGWENLLNKGGGDPIATKGLFDKNYRQDAEKKCVFCGYCNTGCPYDRKNSMSKTYLKMAEQNGARIIPDCEAIHIIFRNGQFGQRNRAKGVRCQIKNARINIVAKEGVVVSAGAMASSQLLLRSGISFAGRKLSFNVGSPVPALYKDPVNAWNGVQMASYVDLGDYLLESLFQPPMAFATVVPGWFGDHFDRMQNYNRLGMIGVLINSANRGRVNRQGKIFFDLMKKDRQRLIRGIAQAARVHFANGAEEVFPATVIGKSLKPGDDIEAHLKNAIHDSDDLTISSAHPQGGNGISRSENAGVVNSKFKVHGYDQLYVCDASIFPTSVRVNPQWTVMAFAHYFVHHTGNFK